MAVIQTVWSIRDANTNKTYKIINADYNQYPLARGKANSFCATMGLEYNRGFVLMRYADVAEIIASMDTGSYAVAGMRLELTISGTGQPQGDESITHKSLKIKSVVSADAGYVDANSAMLVELVDAGYIWQTFDSNGYGRYYATTLSVEYFNRNKPFQQNATSSRTLLTYNEINRLMWGALPTDADGDYEAGSGGGGPFPSTPDLPITPSGYPENVIYGGGNVYEWINYFLSPLWVVPCKDTTLDYWAEYNTQPDWNLVKLGETQSGLSASETAYSNAGVIKYDSGGLHDMSISVAGNYLTSNRVVRSNGTESYYGYGEINDNGSLNGYITNGRGLIAKSTTASTAMTHDVSATLYYPCKHFFDSAPFNYGKYQQDATSAAIPDSIPPGWSVTINTWQKELAGYYAEANGNPVPRHVVYAGVCSRILPGSEVKATLWRNYGDGTCTEVVKYPGWPKSIWRDDSTISDQPALVAPRKTDFDYRRQAPYEAAYAMEVQHGPAVAAVSIGSQMSSGSTKFNGTILYPIGGSSSGACLVESADTNHKLSGGLTAIGIFHSQYTYGGVQYPLFKVADANGQTKQTIVSSAALSGIIPAGLTLTTSTVSRTVMNDAKTD